MEGLRIEVMSEIDNAFFGHLKSARFKPITHM
jgi:hypothetical protein